MANRDNQKKQPTGPPQPTHVSDLILGSLKPRTGRETSRWIAGFVEETLAKQLVDSPLLEAKVPSVGCLPAAASGARQSAVSFVDHLFDFFQQIEFEFNKTVAGTDCVVTIERPTYFTEKVRVRFQQQETVKVFRGRISTRYWTLIMRAHDDIIDGWVIPVEQVFGFRPDDNQYAPFVVMKPVANEAQQACWRVNNAEIPWDQARSLAKQIFAALMRIARGEAPQTEAFSLATGVERASSNFPPTGAATDAGRQRPSLHEKAVELAKVAAPLPAQAPALQQSGRSKQPLGGAQTRKSSPAGDTIDGAIEMLQNALNKDLQKLTEEGSQAFARQDMVAVENIYHKTVRIKELQEQLLAGMQKWQQAVKQALES